MEQSVLLLTTVDRMEEVIKNAKNKGATTETLFLEDVFISGDHPIIQKRSAIMRIRWSSDVPIEDIVERPVKRVI